MAKAIYNEDGSVTYRGKTFRVGDNVVVHRDTGLGVDSIVGKAVRIVIIDNDRTVRCVENHSESWWVLLEDLFEYSEEDEPHQAQPERKPWGMPELKPWMRVVNHNGTYVIAEVEGELVGLRVDGFDTLDFLKKTAIQVYGPPRNHDGRIFPQRALNPYSLGVLLWNKEEADKQRRAYETKEARRQEIQAEIDKLKAKLEAIS